MVPYPKLEHEEASSWPTTSQSAEFPVDDGLFMVIGTHPGSALRISLMHSDKFM